MYTWDDLTQEERGKILPGLQEEINKWYNLPGNVSIVELDKQDKIDADVHINLTNGKVYFIKSTDLPGTWNKYDWANFVVRLLKGQNTKEVGVVREWIWSEASYVLAWWGWVRIYSVTEMINLAGPVGAAPPTPPTPEIWTLCITTVDASTGRKIWPVRIYLDGSYIGATEAPSGYLEKAVQLSPGTHTIRAEKSGYQPAEVTFTI